MESLDPLIGPHTIDEWRDAPVREDGSQLELIWGYWHVLPPTTAPHQNASYRICRALDDAIDASGRTDLYAVQAVGVAVSTAIRYGLIPDVAIVSEPLTRPGDFPAKALELVVEIWSPGNKKRERETKMSGYAVAGVPYLWTVEIKQSWRLDIRGFTLEQGVYKQLVANKPTDTYLELPAPIPVKLELARLIPRS